MKRWKWPLLAAILLALVSCRSVSGEGRDVGRENASPTELQQTSKDLWGREFVAATVTQDGEARPLAPGTPVEVEFAKEERGEVVRWSSCNLSGSLVDITEERLVLLEDEPPSTLMGCTDEFNEQLEWLTSFFVTDPYWVLDGDRLTLSSEETVIELEAKE